ncbi:hypothetical protein ABZ565_10640 [Streptomyces sp. NPDC016469]|uniref:hypothetical protein n=1 Tax=Streptomyces sp. NPDC016469 TaxID=3157191 RepID=UPI0034026D63
MSTLKRAPKHVGAWYWDLEEITPDGAERDVIAATLTAAERCAEILRAHALLEATSVEQAWYAPGSGPTGLTSKLSVPVTPLGDPEVTERVLGSRPSGFPDAFIGNMYIRGPGTWFDAEGNARREPELVTIWLTPDSAGISVEVSVHHDIWCWFDFSGRPHPQVHRRNAPRLAGALQEITSHFGVKPETGEPTYFGHAVGYGISTDDADENGMGLDVTDKL